MKIFINLLFISMTVQAEPFQLPLFENVLPERISINPVFDMNLALDIMTKCIPQKSKFRLELDLIGRVSTDTIYDQEMGNLGQYYIGIVAKIPLYSSIEIERGVKWESDIRIKIGNLIGAIAGNVIIVRKALKEIGLYSALEKRSQARIKVGVAYTEEQIGYLEKVILAQSKKNTAITLIYTARLELISLCADQHRENVNRFLNNIITNALN